METQVTTLDKVISALSYLTGGTVGFIWLIVCFAAEKPMSKFTMFNVYQSIFISFTLYIVSILLTLLLGLLVMIPFVNILVNYINLVVSEPVFYNLSITRLFIFILYVYMIVFSIMGKCAIVPWFSKIIMYQMNRMY